MNAFTVKDIAEISHNAIKAYNESIGDYSYEYFHDSTCDDKEGSYCTTLTSMENLTLSPKEIHARWSSNRLDNGWVFGEELDEDKKTHPFLTNYDDLPKYIRNKDLILFGIVKLLAGI